MDVGRHLSRSQDISNKASLVFQKRAKGAQERFAGELQKAVDENIGSALANPAAAASIWPDWYAYAVDTAQRSILFWDTIRQRGNNFVEHAQAGLLARAALRLRDRARRPQASRGRSITRSCASCRPKASPSIRSGGRTSSSIRAQVTDPGSAASRTIRRSASRSREGHPVYFVIFFRDPEPGQTLLACLRGGEGRSCARCASSIHDSPKPAIVGNCQGGWAAMMLAAADPDDTGPIVINGAPMSYWGGAWQEGGGDNPMRYAGGMLGGTWLASMTADQGDGVFDGAYLVENFENLNPANTFWDKYYHLYANVDTEPPRFLEFERWWGGFYLMNREEIEWITRNLFVGNKLWSGDTKSPAARPSTCATSRRRSSCSPRWATTSRRRSRRSTGSRTCTARPKRSRRAAR